MHASNAARFEAAYKNIADRLKLPRRDDTTVNVLQLVCSWLCSEASGRWLMILDNADDESFFYTQWQQGQGAASNDTRNPQLATLASFIPQIHNGSILITSRNTEVAVKLTGRDKDIIKIQTMNRDQGFQLLQNKLSTPLEGPLLELLAALDYMPLAITQATAYINKRWPRTTVASYVRELRMDDGKKATLLSQAAPELCREEHAANSILATWQISFEHIREQKPSAADLLSFMSFFNPQGIPEFMLRHFTDSSTIAEGKDNRENGENEFEEALDLLRSYSFMTTNLSGDVFEMHRLVQFATRIWLKSFGSEDTWRQKFLAVLSEEFPTGEFSNWSKCQLLLPHVEPAMSQEPSNEQASRNWAQVLQNAAWYTWMQGLYVQAEEMIRLSVSARERTLGEEHPATLTSVSILALVLQGQGRCQAAEQMNQRALEGREKALGKEHPDTLTSVSNLALVLQDQGKYEAAEQMNRRALEGYEKALGKEHPATLTSVSNLALALQGQGRYEAAEQMNRQALEGREKALGKEHPDTLTSVSILASVLQGQGKYKAAEQMNRQALEGREKALGKEHPATLTSVSILASVLQGQGKYEAAEQMNQRALEGREKALGKEHPDTLTSVSKLASVLQDQGKYEAAEQMNRRALEGYEKALGKEHPNTLTSVSNLALVLQGQGKYEAAEQMNRRALEGYEKALGKEHPDTLTSVSNLALVLQDQGKYEAAEQMNRRALEGREKALGKEHPATLTSVYCLAYLYHQQKQYDTASELYRRACDAYKRALGPDHPTTITCCNNYSRMVQEMDQSPR